MPHTRGAAAMVCVRVGDAVGIPAGEPLDVVYCHRCGRPLWATARLAAALAKKSTSLRFVCHPFALPSCAERKG
jgi:hypothetical protein